MKRFFEGAHWGFRIFSENEEVGHNVYKPVRYKAYEKGKFVGEFKTRNDAIDFVTKLADERLAERRSRKNPRA